MAIPEALTDYWAVTCRPRRHYNCAYPGRWKKEIRLTNESFDLLDAPVAGGLFPGDYAGLSGSGKEFMAVFGLASFTDPASIFARRFKGAIRGIVNHDDDRRVPNCAQ